jgi:proline iminopeptidase
VLRADYLARVTDTATSRFLAFRRSLPRPPRLEHRTVRARGIDFAVFLSPEVPGATPLLCINGGLIFDHGILWPALSPLAARRQLVLYDQRGRGRTPAPPGARAARIEHDAGDVPALREALGIARWDVLGHSWGGGIAVLGVALDLARDPAAVRRLVLVDAVGPTGWWLPRLVPDGVARLEARGDARGAEELRAFLSEDIAHPDAALHARYARALYPAWFADPELARLLSPPHARSATGAAVAARLRTEGYDWRASVRALRVPTLVIHGDGDLLPVAVAREIGAELPQARVAIVSDAGHMPFWESPARFFELVEDFLAR